MRTWSGGGHGREIAGRAWLCASSVPMSTDAVLRRARTCSERACCPPDESCSGDCTRSSLAQHSTAPHVRVQHMYQLPSGGLRQVVQHVRAMRGQRASRDPVRDQPLDVASPDRGRAPYLRDVCCSSMPPIPNSSPTSDCSQSLPPSPPGRTCVGV